MTSHRTNIIGRIRLLKSEPSAPESGDEYYNKTNHTWNRYTGNNWLGAQFTATSPLNSTAIETGVTGTHLTDLINKKRTLAAADIPITPQEGEFFFDDTNNRMGVYENAQWSYANFTTTTSTSTSTTTTSTSTTTTSTSSSTSTTTSTSTSTSTSTTTTL